MMVRRSVAVSLKFATEKKRQKLESLLEEYRAVTRRYIDLAWENSSVSLDKETLSLVQDTTLSERFKSNALRQALSIVSSTKKSARALRIAPSKPEFKGTALFDAKFVFVNLDAPNSFDGWIYLSSLNKGQKIWIPFKRTKVLNKFLSKGFHLVHSIRLRKYNNNLYADLILEKDIALKGSGNALGVDSGTIKALSLSDGSHLGDNYHYYSEKIRRKKHKSKAWYRALKERDNYIRQEINKIDLSGVKEIFAEDLRNIKKDTKKNRKVNKSTRKLLSTWVQAKTFGWLKDKAEENCVSFSFVPAKYTSQTCSRCGHREKSNRQKELFKCKKCSFTLDADYNAARNILSVGLRSLESRRLSQTG